MNAIAFAIDAEGEEVLPDEASKSEKGYKCPDCSEELEFCHGAVIRPYFRHKADKSQCMGGGGEGKKHRYAKHIFKYALQQWTIQQRCQDCYQDFETQPFQKMSAKLEVAVCGGLYRVDLKIGKDCIVEVFHTHKVSPDKLIALQKEFSVYEFKAQDIIDAYKDRKYMVKDLLLACRTCPSCFDFKQRLAKSVCDVKFVESCCVCRARQEVSVFDEDVKDKHHRQIELHDSRIFISRSDRSFSCLRKVPCELCSDKIRQLTGREWDVLVKCEARIDKCRGETFRIRPVWCQMLQRIAMGDFGKQKLQAVKRIGDNLLTMLREDPDLCRNCEWAKSRRPCKQCKQWGDKKDMNEAQVCKYCTQGICWKCKCLDISNCDECRKFTETKSLTVYTMKLCKRCNARYEINERFFSWKEDRHLLTSDYRSTFRFAKKVMVESCGTCECVSCHKERKEKHYLHCRACLSGMLAKIQEVTIASRCSRCKRQQLTKSSMTEALYEQNMSAIVPGITLLQNRVPVLCNSCSSIGIKRKRDAFDILMENRAVAR